MENFLHDFAGNIQSTGTLEYLAVCSGILSVWFSKKENVWVYPVGLINTCIYIYLSAKASLFGESVVNGYYTIMSVYGWWSWLSKDHLSSTPQLSIRISSRKWVRFQFAFFISIFILFFIALTIMKENFYPGAIPVADSLASAAAFTGMWLMTRKKVESWYWWILTNSLSIPLYIYKGYALTGVYYLILLILAFFGLRSWMQKAKALESVM